MDIKAQRPVRLSRRLMMVLGSLLLIYPLIRFINHRVPRKPKTVEVSGTVKPDGFLVREDFILFSSGSKIWAVTRTCTHLGCRLNYKEKEEFLECPCHQSRFARTGEVLRGPAKRALTSYQVEEKSDPQRLLVTIQ